MSSLAFLKWSYGRSSSPQAVGVAGRTAGLMSDVHEVLEDLLDSHAAEGQEVEEGVFTLSPEKTLAKLAEFQLPFKGAWVLKIVQAAVLSGAPALAVQSTVDETIFRLAPEPAWKLDEVEAAVWQPQHRPAPALRHLAVGLWSVGIGARRDFHLELAGEKEALVWTCGELKRQSLGASASATRLTVRHLPADAGALSSLFSRVATAFENAEVLTVIRDRCFTCPIPLTLDGRRMDSLQLSPQNGWSHTTDLLSLAIFQDEELPPLPLSPMTVQLPPVLRPGGCVMEAPELPTKTSKACSAAVLVTVNVQLGSKGSHIHKKARSLLYWVQDGVVVEIHPWLGEESFCSLGCVLSARGIGTDLSTLALQQDPALEARARRAAELCRRLLEESDWSAMRAWTEQSTRRDHKFAKVIAGMGVVTLPVLPIGLTLLGVGGLFFVLSGANQIAIQQAILRDLPGLLAKVKAAVEDKRGLPKTEGQPS